MVFFCQKFSFATKLESTVVSCQPAVVQVEVEAEVCSSSKSNAKAQPSFKNVPCYEVTFEDTVFFAEGGGQPDDRGFVKPLHCPECGYLGTSNQQMKEQSSSIHNSPSVEVAALLFETVDDSSSVGRCPHGVEVLRVLRKGSIALHYLDDQLAVGSQVVQVINWTRRKDHMQQHSAQHLLTAVAEQLYGAATTSWSLGRRTSCLELHTTCLTEAQLEQIESKANAVIAAGLPVSVSEYTEGDELPETVRSRGLPPDHEGAVRVVSISGLDQNMCCGTHVTNTSQLQALKIIGMEPGKPGKTLVTFVAGDRLLRYTSNCLAILRALNPLLHTAPEEYLTVVSKLQRSLKAAEKSSKEALKDLAAAEAKLLMQKAKALIEDLDTTEPQDTSKAIRKFKVVLVKLDESLKNSKKSEKETQKLQIASSNENQMSQEASSNSLSAENSCAKNAYTEGAQSQYMPKKLSGGDGDLVVSCDMEPLILVTHHRRLADMDYVNSLANNFTLKNAVLLVTGGDDRGPGVMVLTGPEQLVQLLGPKVAAVLEGKGGGKTRYTAKVLALHKRRAAVDAACSLLTALPAAC